MFSKFQQVNVKEIDLKNSVGVYGPTALEWILKQLLYAELDRVSSIEIFLESKCWRVTEPQAIYVYIHSPRTRTWINHKNLTLLL